MMNKTCRSAQKTPLTFPLKQLYCKHLFAHYGRVWGFSIINSINNPWKTNCKKMTTGKRQIWVLNQIRINMKPNQNAKWINVYIYSFSGRFYPKWLINEALYNKSDSSKRDRNMRGASIKTSSASCMIYTREFDNLCLKSEFFFWL